MKNILNKFNTAYEYIEFQNISIAIIKNESDNYNFIQYINGINVYNGGKPLEYIENGIVNAFRELLPKKYEKIKPGDIRNKMTLVVVFKNMKNPRFGDQIKSQCVNTAGMFSDITKDVDFNKVAKQVYKNKEIKNTILEYFDMKAQWEEKKALQNLNKPKKKIRIEKYKAPINEQKYLLLAEGLSAGGSVYSATGRDNIGMYTLKGKVLNCVKASITQLKKNQEIKDIIDILGLDLTSKEPVNYQHLLICTDADLDGYSITSLILTLFVTFRPDLIQQGFIKFLKTPIVVGYKNNKPKDFMFAFNELKEHQSKYKGFDYKYKKGLASMDIVEWEILFKDGIEPYCEPLEWTEDLPEVFDIWMGNDSQKRKEQLCDTSFNLFMI